MILRDTEPRDFAAVHRLVSELGYAPDEPEFRRRFDSGATSPRLEGPRP